MLAGLGNTTRLDGLQAPSNVARKIVWEAPACEARGRAAGAARVVCAGGKRNGKRMVSLAHAAGDCEVGDANGPGNIGGAGDGTLADSPRAAGGRRSVVVEAGEAASVAYKRCSCHFHTVPYAALADAAWC
jgi:hypothetical protein